MIRERLRETLKRDEGFELKRHEVQGVDHIGYGINLEENLPDSLLEYLGVEDEDDIQEITQEQADHLLDHFIEVADLELSELFNAQWLEMSPLRKEVLVNLHFNLGLPRLKGFRKMIAAIRKEDWEEAATQMLNSKAARQTGDRYERLARALHLDHEPCLMLERSYDDNDMPRSEQKETGLEAFTDQELIDELSRRLGYS